MKYLPVQKSIKKNDLWLEASQTAIPFLTEVCIVTVKTK